MFSHKCYTGINGSGDGKRKFAPPQNDVTLRSASDFLRQPLSLACQFWRRRTSAEPAGEFAFTEKGKEDPWLPGCRRSTVGWDAKRSFTPPRHGE
ncbi:hypothetical protein PHSY_001976 [Pseudozyma hubeiensis SY62]|uniref:Uncharacterized protein n=1 Tax=Pseudozyma hubeiensis (strain SY62) TaxID=1305764 RepID=R9P8K8_PSEHS|nr:hypothetical protein PHSY_001976 [Pseudozyma hubeiensis SY62]GAC94405.1 hypothetical protein PHSY_001976 [Pseudozyma hubeiensis SY62]